MRPSGYTVMWLQSHLVTTTRGPCQCETLKEKTCIHVTTYSAWRVFKNSLDIVLLLTAFLRLPSAVVAQAALWSFLNDSISPPRRAPSHRNCSGIKQNSKVRLLESRKHKNVVNAMCTLFECAVQSGLGQVWILWI